MSLILKKLVSLMPVIALCFVCYLLGRTHAKVAFIQKDLAQTVKHVEVIGYVHQQADQIYSAPHIGREHALELFKRGIL